MYLANLLRHLVDLKERNYHGAVSREEKEKEMARSVALFDPVVGDVLGQANREFLLDTGELRATGVRSEEGGFLAARWTLTWPEQRGTAPVGGRGGGAHLAPVEVAVVFPAQMHHPHLCGSAGGFWPFNVESAEDAEKLRPTLEAIVGAGLHQRVFEAGGAWQIIPMMTKRGESDSPLGSQGLT